jgi:hypothetical protein
MVQYFHVVIQISTAIFTSYNSAQGTTTTTISILPGTNYYTNLSDCFWWKKPETLIPILLFVDILSRKAWTYCTNKRKKEKRAEVSVKTIQGFKDEVGLIRGLESDNEFSSAPIRNFCENYDIRLDISVAKEEQISNHRW